ncbi:glycoside hydrolase family 88 protein [Paenibacillus macquariensis]|uniref:Unsaturated chondroitin disaccharide hydrolase n=1 Tax=Paenibacillus macquariensis TaxID=948756 RepID=A0ABY1JKW7_9BACL|nr:glycoside hydrolase family 88 protein [Paenibacillus macquariensis]MEC0090023.1 glycoside hydrolase family 88 protein [Paenibacillus macquariensis]OAB31094.1 glycosyl hydrolase [Paenibacillus macquariensis subsp. macquariensis]SIQ36290.1 unsaturated chondroitin disaccharide hydrolase [Paenibacillus macquariensis]
MFKVDASIGADSWSAQWVDEIWHKIIGKVERMNESIGADFPYISDNGKYNREEADWWTNGFWPGLIWLVYRESKVEQLKDTATQIEAKMDSVLTEFYPLHHDVGFMWSLSSVAKYKLLGCEDSKRRAMTAASHLVGRYNAKGCFIRAWNQPERVGWAIIDCMMNLPLLYWASQESGDPRFRHVATLHADTTLREFLRPDGSTHHIVCFDPDTGERKEALSGQGYSPDSAWSRGTAWALYGMALSARYTGDDRYLDAAKRAAHFFLANVPDDGLPPWDFRAPWEEGMAMDSSASACAASGMLELSLLVPKGESELYRRAAEKLIFKLNEKYMAWDDSSEEAILKMGTANRPKNTHVNVPMIYGDYFFAEAVCKLRGVHDTFW